MRSHRSRNSGAGGLWLVRMALQPISRRISKRRSHTRSGTAAPTAPRIVVQAHAVELDVLAVQQESAVGVEERFANAERRFVLIDHLRATRTVLRTL